MTGPGAEARAGVCVTGLPSGGTTDPDEYFDLHRVSCSDPSAKLRIFEGGPGTCRRWSVMIGTKHYCATELMPSTTPD